MTGDPARALVDLTGEACAPVAAPIAAIVQAARARHGGVAAVLFYGSCLRHGDEDGKIADLYLIVDSYRRAYRSPIAAVFNWLLPPNVSYIETDNAGTIIRAKYAVITLRDFERGATGRWLHPYIWARFAQPCRLAYWRDDTGRDRVLAALAGAHHSLAREVGPLIDDDIGSPEFWVRGFEETYRTELRAEPPGRAAELVEAGPQRYRRIGELLRAGSQIQNRAGRFRANVKWAVRRPLGKFLSVARLIKAAFTFEDGGTYILWKIERHSGVSVRPSPWQRRHPILAATSLAWRLYRKGAFK